MYLEQKLVKISLVNNKRKFKISFVNNSKITMYRS